ncbi:MAG: UDP-glucose 4-epimerase GalE [Burkholderiales bacterium]|nr:UDP-glucose 4-epimerase GalE [Burkholderiales bacterium]
MILLTGATGYIGSHTWLALDAAAMPVVGIDDFSNSSPEVLRRLAALGADVSRFAQVDVTDRAALAEVFERWPIEAVVHFAAKKAVGESVARPLLYYANNVGGTIALAETMRAHGCRRIVFSSTATVYGQPRSLPVREDAALEPSSPYASTKLMSENILRDVERSDPAWRIALLRYFNPVGAHPSGTIGEDPRGTPNNLMPFVAQVAVGKRARLQVFGSDYETADGSGVRDYLHVQDLAEGHVAALKHLLGGGDSLTLNLGTGQGVSVLELVRAFERASGRPVPYEIAPRRPGDVAAYYADPALAERLLGWKARLGLDAMCADSWRWQAANPDGYAGS